MKRKQLRFIGYFLIIVVIAALIIGTAACSKKTNTTTTLSSTLSSILITPMSPVNIALGTTKSLSATGTYSNGTSDDISSQVTWLSSDTTVATISSAGLVTGIAAGTTNITASLSGITSPIVTVTVISP